ncbi:hypothetical protein ACCT30_20615, partial [Rhizobium ruizarguesonis]
MVFLARGIFRPMSRYPALQAVEGRRSWNFFHQTYLLGKGNIEILDLRVESWKRPVLASAWRDAAPTANHGVQSGMSESPPKE